MDDARANLDSLIRERGEDYASISRLLGRNLAYIQQFVKRGTPKKLDEDDRDLLARYFGVDASLLGGRAATPGGKMVAIPQLAVGASAGGGALSGDERTLGHFEFDAGWLRQLGTPPASLSIIRVEGDSMLPTLADGDDIMVDRSEGGQRLRDGLYVIRLDDAVIVKRLAQNLRGGFEIRSDNPAYPAVHKLGKGADVIGRVVWVGRKLI